MTDPRTVTFGTPLTPHARRVLLLGSGELGKEVTIELQRFGIEVIACDRYDAAPAMQVAHRSHTLDMLDPAALRELIAREKPDLVVPEIEAIHTRTLVELEAETGQRVVPTARAARLTMDREGIRRLAAETLGVPTSPYRFVDFDYEITLLTLRHRDGTSFCPPVGHRQEAGDYRESWMPQPMSTTALARSQAIAERVTAELGGWGLFGVELFVRGDDVWFSEVSPRPHDTGLVTLISQELSQFALHARAILGLPVPNIAALGPSASCAVLAHGHGVPEFSGVDAALAEPDTALRLFGKPRVEGHRRVAVTLARGADIDEARAKARRAAAALQVTLR